MRPESVPTPAAWLALLDTAPDRRLADAAADVVDTLGTRPEGLPAALRRFGHDLGSDGWPIDQVMANVQALLTLATRAQRRRLRHWSALSALAEGWASGYVRGAHSGMCVDPATGLVTAMVLRLRMREVAAQCRSLGITVSDGYLLVIVDLDTSALEPLEADLLMACAAEATMAVFSSGETVARAGDRLLVLAPRNPATVERSHRLYERLAMHPTTNAGSPMVVVDTLPGDGDSVEAYLTDLFA